MYPDFYFYITRSFATLTRNNDLIDSFKKRGNTSLFNSEPILDSVLTWIFHSIGGSFSHLEGDWNASITMF